MSNVIRLHKRPMGFFSPGPLFEQAWRAFPETGRRRSSRRLSAPEWARAACEAGEGALLAAVQRYAAEDVDSKASYGAPGFHRWLANARWEAWLDDDALAPVVFADAKMRASFCETFRDERARKWFDRCALAGDMLVVPHLPRLEWVNGPFAKWALAHEIGGWRLAG